MLRPSAYVLVPLLLSAPLLASACSEEAGSSDNDTGGKSMGVAGDSADGGTTGSGGKSADGGGKATGGDSASGGTTSATGGEGGAVPSELTGASRTEGAAPLYVHFSALAEGELATLDKTYHWQFDTSDIDPNGRHEELSGFVAGHVFEAPGDYTTVLNVYSPEGELEDTRTWTIKVSAFDTKKTVYVSSAGKDSNPGTLEAPVKTATHALQDLALPNTKVLFRMGDTFEEPGRSTLSGTGPVYVGSYPNDEDPSNTAPPVWLNTDVDGTDSTFRINTNDWRFVGIRMSSTGRTAGNDGPSYPGALGISGEAEHNLFIDMEYKTLGFTAVTLSGKWNGLFDSTWSDLGMMAVFSSGSVSTGNSIIGNVVTDVGWDQAEHVIRLQQADHAVVAFNHFRATNTKSNVQVRGDSHHVVVYGNILDRSSSFRPQNNTSEEHVHHCILDSNVLIGREDPAYDAEFDVRGNAFSVQAKDNAIRNNVFYNYEKPVSVGQHDLVGGSERTMVYNNTFVCLSAPCKLVDVKELATETEVWNNIAVSETTSAAEDMFLSLDASTFSGRSDANTLFGASWKDTTILFALSGRGDNLADWQSKTGQDTSSGLDDPGFAALTPENVDLDSLDLTLAVLAKADAWRPTADAVIDTALDRAPVLDLYGKIRKDRADRGAAESK